MSRQQEYRLKMSQQGRRVQCGRDAVTGIYGEKHSLCMGCKKKARDRYRKKNDIPLDAPPNKYFKRQEG